MLSSQSKAYLFALSAVLAWSTVSTAFKLSLRFLSPLGLLLFSSLAATLFLVGVNAYQKGTALFSNFIPNLRSSLVSGLLNPCVYYLMLFVAYHRLRAQEAQVLNYTWAIVLSVMSIIILRERFRIKDILALAASFIGVIIISTRGKVLQLNFTDPFGSALAVSTSLVWAAYWILNMRDPRPAEQKLMYNFMVGAALVACYALIRAGMGEAPLFTQNLRIPAALWGALYVGIFEMGFTFILWLRALSFSRNTASVANLIFITPFISLLFIALILRESIHPATVVGLVIIVLSNLWEKWNRSAPIQKN